MPEGGIRYSHRSETSNPTFVVFPKLLEFPKWKKRSFLHSNRHYRGFVCELRLRWWIHLETLWEVSLIISDRSSRVSEMGCSEPTNASIPHMDTLELSTLEAVKFQRIASPYIRAKWLGSRSWGNVDICRTDATRWVELQRCHPTLMLVPIRTHRFATLTSKQCDLCKVWGFHGGDYEEWRLVGCNAV
jgi:hypothetical protein